VDYKDRFMVTLEAQNLTHLVGATHPLVDAELDDAQQKFMCKVMKDALLHPEAKSIVKFIPRTKILGSFGRKYARPTTNLLPL